MKILYISDADDKWAIAEDKPNIRAMLNDLDNLFEDEVPPITITEVEVEEGAVV